MKKLWATIKEIVREVCTDVAGRWEIKTILGIPTFIAGVVHALCSGTIVVGGFLVGTALTCFGINAVADSKLDKLLHRGEA